MKFLTFTDLHEDKPALRALIKRAAQKDIDFVVCCGDFSNFGSGIKNVLSSFNKLNKKFYFIPGNHEESLDLLELVKSYPNCISFHEQTFIEGNYLFLGYGGGGFAQEDEQFRKVSRQWYGEHKDKKIVLVTHMPPYATKLDLLEMGHVGNKDYLNFIRRIKPKLAISGHLHETVGAMDKIDRTQIVNPGWDGMVIELN
jgi:uncharacterized protein